MWQVWLKLVQWFWKGKFLNFVNLFSLFRKYLPMKKDRALHLNKLESPSPKDALCQVWLKLAQWFWRRRFLNFVNVFSLFRNYLPLEKDRSLYLNKLEFPSPKDALSQVWLKLVQWFWRRRLKCENFTDRRTDERQAIRKAYLSFQLRWAKKWSFLNPSKRETKTYIYYLNSTLIISMGQKDTKM